MITTDTAPEPLNGTDTNPRCDRCKCTAHTDGKCPNRWCGCRTHRDPEAGAFLAQMVVLVATVLTCLAFALALLAASHIGQHLRCERLTAANSPAVSTYCNGDTK